MSINQFCESETQRLQAFKQHWYDNIYPTLSDEDRSFWDYSASLWDWVDRYEEWASK